MDRNESAGPPLDLTASIRQFAQRNPDYYVDRFSRIQSAKGRIFPFNMMAALIGPLWSAARGLWGFFWVFAILELFALVQIGRGLWGDLGAGKIAEAAKLQEKSAELLSQAERAQKAGDTNATSLLESGNNLMRAARERLAEAEQVVAGGTDVLVLGFVLFFAVRAAMGWLANAYYEAQFTRWQINRSIPSGVRPGNIAFGVVLIAAMYPLSLYRFTASNPAASIVNVPVKREYFTETANILEKWIDQSAEAGKGVFDSVTAAIGFVLEALEYVLVSTPWPVIFIFLFLLAWRAANVRVAIFCSAGLAYLGLFGFWETSMITFALTGTAALICVLLGIPLGIWFSKSTRAYAIARPVLDLMQTVPPFVYLIPIIAFFGTGRVPGVLATIIVSMPPLVRLTTLGLLNVDKHVKEAARAFGAGKRQILFGIELPLALPSIMAGINQTIMLSLGMVVIASLIGAKGLGQEVLTALQRLAKGDGALAGLAILVSALILDRIIQGRFQRQEVGRN